MFPHSASSNIINTSSTATGNYYESAVSFPHDQSFLIHSRQFLSDITPNPNPNPNPNSNSDSIISNSKQYQDLEEDPNHHIHPPLSVFYFPSPFEDVDVLLHQHHHLHDHEPLALQETISLAHNHHHHQTSFPLTAKMVDWDANKNDQVVINKEGEQQQKQIPMLRKRSCKRDRHSKISTARGLRDRRMRLSLDVARKFFGLQDVLGFDKASKTVEWLLNQACAEIKKVTRERSGQNQNQSSSTTTATGPGARTTSSISECEVISGTDEVATDDIIDKVSRPNPSSSCTKDRIKKIIRKPKKSSLFNPHTKASREKARARARARTRERMGRQSKPCDDVDQATKTKDLSRLNSWSTFETGEESGGTQSHNNNINNNNIHSSLEVLAEVEEPISSFQAAGTSSTTTDHHQDLIAIDGHDAAANMAIMEKWSPYSSSIFNYLQNTTGSISQEVYMYYI